MPNNSKKTQSLFVFQIGKTPLLSLAELLSFFTPSNLVDISKNNIIIYDDSLNQREINFLNNLGGSLRLSKVFQELPIESSPELFSSEIANHILQNSSFPEKKITFGVNIYPEHYAHLLKRITTSVKNKLKKHGLKTRFINKNFQNIPSSAAYQEKMINDRNFEINIIHGSKNIYLSQTKAIQNIDKYSLRDYEKPCRDPHSGMLPPKLAQIMINISTSRNNSTTLPPCHSTTLYDPFCGSGTILTEGLLMGFNVIGSDISEKAVSLAEQNINWLRQQFKIEPSLKSKLFIQDATRISPVVQTHCNASLPPAVITEPYLGTPLTREPTPEQITQIQSELKSLYLKFFQKLAEILPEKTPIVIIFPYIKAHNKKYFLQIAPEIEKLGFKTETIIPEALQEKFNLGLNKFPSLLYERKNQLVGREIWKFVKL